MPATVSMFFITGPPWQYPSWLQSDGFTIDINVDWEYGTLCNAIVLLSLVVTMVWGLMLYNCCKK